MCGRLNITDSPVVRWLLDVLGIPFTTQANVDLRPTQTVDTITALEWETSQLVTTWRIKPVWSKSLLINAQAESVTVKPTFKKTFETQRCIVPCTGWYEWRSEGGPRKQKYALTHADGIPFLMAGIWFGDPSNAQLVTLTASPGKRCAEIHNRMPLLIDPENMAPWLNESASELGAMLATNREDHILIAGVS